MSALYDQGWKAFIDGEPLDEKQPDSWKSGWLDSQTNQADMDEEIPDILASNANGDFDPNRKANLCHACTEHGENSKHKYGNECPYFAD